MAMPCPPLLTLPIPSLALLPLLAAAGLPALAFDILGWGFTDRDPAIQVVVVVVYRPLTPLTLQLSFTMPILFLRKLSPTFTAHEIPVITRPQLRDRLLQSRARLGTPQAVAFQ